MAEALLPERHPQPDFFVCDILDAAPKGDLGSMEHPIFSLSTKPDMRVRDYKNGDVFVRVSPSEKGIATIHDRDVLIFCISHLVRAINNSEPVSQRIRFNAQELMEATNRQTSGRGYQLLKDALFRLSHTAIETNISTAGEEVWSTFSLLEDATIVRKTRDGRMQTVEVTLSRWLYNAVQAKEVLTISRSYFRLRKPLERRLYEIARKHCGNQHHWKISLDKLQHKCGSSQGRPRDFRRQVEKIEADNVASDHFPDYVLNLEGNFVSFFSRGTAGLLGASESSNYIPPLDPETYDMARKIAPGWDVKVIEAEWRKWSPECPRNPEVAFLRFVAKWSDRKSRG